MKINRYTFPITVAIGAAALSNAGCAKKNEPMVQSPPPASREMPSLAATAKETTPAAATAPMASADVATVRWEDIKDNTFEARAAVMTGVKAMEAKVDIQIAELKAKRATMNGSPSAKDWDFAMKEMSDARSYLKSMGTELGKATAETWAQQKEKVGQAWTRVQDAHSKVRSSTTGWLSRPTVRVSITASN